MHQECKTPVDVKKKIDFFLFLRNCFELNEKFKTEYNQLFFIYCPNFFPLNDTLLSDAMN